MTPTTKLRFVKRHMGQDNGTRVYAMILQQWWEGEAVEHWDIDGDISHIEPARGEWRDVVVEEETK